MSTLNMIQEQRRLQLLAWVDSRPMNRRHWTIFLVCAVAFLFDSFDLQVISLAAPMFLEHLLGFRLSDRAMHGDRRWLRCNQDHHGIGLMRGRNQLHHYAWEVEGLPELERLGDLLSAYGMRFLYGPGRHGPGNNIFTYHLDPAGAVVEYYADLQRIYNEASYQPRDWSDDPYWINYWGPKPPDMLSQQGVDVLER